MQHTDNKCEATYKVVKSINELGVASYLTQGAEKGWFEYGRPGHPKDFKPPYNSNEINNHILNQKTYI